MIFGAQIDEDMGDEIRITVIATGFEQSRVKTRLDAQQQQQRPATQPRPQQQPRQQQSQPQQQQPPQQPQVRQQPQQPQRPQQDNFNSRVYDEDDMDIPPFLRRNRK